MSFNFIVIISAKINFQKDKLPQSLSLSQNQKLLLMLNQHPNAQKLLQKSLPTQGETYVHRRIDVTYSNQTSKHHDVVVCILLFIIK